MATYGEIRTKFLSRLNRRDCSNSLADGFLQDAITRTQRLLRVPAMERGVAITISDVSYFDNGYLAVPVDYLKMREISVTLADGTKRSLVRKPLAEVQAGTALQDYPYSYARQGASFVLAPYPLVDQVIRIDYYAEFPTTDEVDDRTNLTDTASDLLVYGALSYAADHWSDKRGESFEGRYTQILSDIQAMADDDELAGTAVVQQGFTYPEDI